MSEKKRKNKKGAGNPAWHKGMVTPYSGGRPAGHPNKKTRALNAIYAVMNRTPNLERFYNELQKRFDHDPVEFYKEFVRPHEPKEFNLDLDNTGERPLLTANTPLTNLSYEDLLAVKKAQTTLLKKAHPDPMDIGMKDAKKGDIE